MENLGEAPVAKPGYSSGLVCKESRKPQVAGSNPARGFKASLNLRLFCDFITNLSAPRKLFFDDGTFHFLNLY